MRPFKLSDAKKETCLLKSSSVMEGLYLVQPKRIRSPAKNGNLFMITDDFISKIIENFQFDFLYFLTGITLYRRNFC